MKKMKFTISKSAMLMLTLAILVVTLVGCATNFGIKEVKTDKKYTFTNPEPELAQPDAGFQIDGIADEEEYQNAMSEAQAYYYEKLKGYSSLYQVAVTTDSKVIKDAWSTDYASMTYETERWMQNVSSYVGDVSDAFIDWKDAISDPETGVESIVGGSLDEIGNNVDAVTTKS
jgi:hypothetical protein